jgi:hypothetical protein
MTAALDQPFLAVGTAITVGVRRTPQALGKHRSPVGLKHCGGRGVCGQLSHGAEMPFALARESSIPSVIQPGEEVIKPEQEELSPG